MSDSLALIRPESRATKELAAPPLQPVLATNSSVLQHGDRDPRLDFFRGLALLFIFINHIPGNFFSNFTVRSVAFAEAAEVFIFVSGYTAALAYGTLLASKGAFITTMRVYGRVWQLYVGHIFLFIVFAGMISHHALMHSEISVAEFGVGQLVNAPQSALLGIVLLQYQPAFFDILPLSIVLLAAFPAALAVMARQPAVALALSSAIYVLTEISGWKAHGYADGQIWFFNPLAWQFLFILGAVLAYPRSPSVEKVLAAKWFAIAAAVVTALAAVTRLSWVVHLSLPEVPGILSTQLAPWAAEKTNLNPMRLASFLALAITTAHFLQPRSWLLRARPAKWLMACGQHSLPVFCLGILLSVSGYFAFLSFDNGFVVQAVVNLLGCALMIGLARLLDWYKTDFRLT